MLKRRGRSFEAVSLRALIIIFALAFTAWSQQDEPHSGSRVSPAETPEGAHARCKKASNCFDAGAYTVSVIDTMEGDIPGYRIARLMLRFENLTDGLVVLGYRSGSSYMVDNFRNRYSCCRADPSREDTSAIGIGTDKNDKLDTQFMLKPRQTDSASFDLWRHRPPDQQALSFHFEFMLDEIDPNGLKTILRRSVVFFRNLPAKPSETEQAR